MCHEVYAVYVYVHHCTLATAATTSDALPLTDAPATREPRGHTRPTPPPARAYCTFPCSHIYMYPNVYVLIGNSRCVGARARERERETDLRYRYALAERGVCSQSVRSTRPPDASETRARLSGASVRERSSRHRPSVWPTTRRYPTERRTATTRVPSRFSPPLSDPFSPSSFFPSSYPSLLALALAPAPAVASAPARVRGHHTLRSLLCYYLPFPTSTLSRTRTRSYTHTHLTLLLLFLPSAFKAVRVLRYARNIMRFFLEAQVRAPCHK